jgi:hypothetical protein
MTFPLWSLFGGVAIFGFALWLAMAFRPKPLREGSVIEADDLKKDDLKVP